MGLPDLRAYLEALYTLTSQYYSSMGVVCLDIPGFSSHSGRRSFESGSRMLWYVAHTLEELFGPALLFGLLHLDLAQGLTAFVCGLFLGWLTERTGSVLPGMVVHFLNCGRFSSAGIPSRCRSAGPGRTANLPDATLSKKPRPPCIRRRT